MYPITFPLVSDPCSNRELDRIQVFWIVFLSEAPTYLNSNPKEKLQVDQWLISATLPEFSHLQASATEMGQ
jgi:hypothetical protein